MAKPGPLIVIGGKEDKEGDREILCRVADHCGGGKMVIVTVGSGVPDEYFAEYKQIFRSLGVKDIQQFHVTERVQSSDPKKLACFEGATAIFMTGGDQLRIASQMGDTPAEAALRKAWEAGAVIAGTSAGASVMSDIMMVGVRRDGMRIGDMHMASGFGLVRNVIIDQHFAERGRISRLISAVSHNPRILGIGVDEDTAFVLEGERLLIVGVGAVYVVDGEQVTHSNIGEADAKNALSVYDLKLHVLRAGDQFDLDSRRPIPTEAVAASAAAANGATKKAGKKRAGNGKGKEPAAGGPPR